MRLRLPSWGRGTTKSPPSQSTRRALGDDAIVVAAGLVRPTRHHQAVVLVADLPLAGIVADAHVDDEAVVVDVGIVEAGAELLLAGQIAPIADPFVEGQRLHDLGAVGIDPRHEIEDLLIQQLRDQRIVRHTD